MTPIIKSVELPHGLTLRYVEQGDASGVPMLLLHGFTDSWRAGELGTIQAPTLVIWGARDTLCSRRDQESLLTAIAESRLLVYEAAGPALHWEEPERFAANVDDGGGT